MQQQLALLQVVTAADTGNLIAQHLHYCKCRLHVQAALTRWQSGAQLRSKAGNTGLPPHSDGIHTGFSRKNTELSANLLLFYTRTFARIF
jgi:hypothetical protein